MLVSIFALALAVQTEGGAPPQEGGTPQSEIVVIAQRNADALARCLRDGCPPIEDIKASIAVAEQMFVDGDYRQARTTLRQAIGRNKQFASELPTAVAALYEASANVNLHFGDLRTYRGDVANRVDIIRDSAATGSAQQVMASALLGDMWLSLGDAGMADQSYRSAAAKAVATGHSRLAAYVELRRVAMQLSASNPRRAAELLRRVEAGPDADDPGVRQALSAMRVRIAAARGDGAALDRALADLAALPPGSTPVMLHADPIAASVGETAEATEALWGPPIRRALSGSNVLRWIDVGFAIGPEGRPRDIEILRGRMHAERSAAVLRHIASRRYAPFTPEDGAAGTYRVERYTLRSSFAMAIGSLIERRAGPQGLEMIDITRTPALPPTAGS